MKIFGYTIFEKTSTEKKDVQAFTRPDIGYSISGGTAWSFSIYNGEKNLGNLGPATEFMIDNPALRTRGWEAYLTNETVQTIINKMVVWVIGRGLRLRADPNIKVLKSEGIIITDDQAQEISDLIEARFSLYKEQKFSCWCKEKNLSQLESTAFRNSKIGGDVLVLLYFDGEFPSVRLIDGAHVQSPQGGDDWSPRVLGNGNRIINGVEINENGEHVAYHVRQANASFERYECCSESTGLRIAYLVGGLEFRLDYARCIPAISGVLEVLATMDRYKMATLETAEESSKMTLQVTYGPNSTGENPFVKQLQKARDGSANDGMIPVDANLKKVADSAAVSTGKQVVQNVQDSKVEPIEKSKAELYFKDFYSVFFDIVCAAINMPPNVAMSKYDTSFSSARAAVKDWEHTLLIERYNFALGFLQPIYEMWLYVEVFKNKIQLPGYINAYLQGNRMALAAFNQSRWIGDSVPHIDPLKEVNAIREMLGGAGANFPLIDHEQAVEILDKGDSTSILRQFAKERDEAETLGIDMSPVNNSNSGKQIADDEEAEKKTKD